MRQIIFFIRPEDFPEDNLEHLCSLVVNRLVRNSAEDYYEKFLISELHNDDPKYILPRNDAMVYGKSEVNGKHYLSILAADHRDIQIRNLQIAQELSALTALMQHCEEERRAKNKYYGKEHNKDGWKTKETATTGVMEVIKEPVWANALNQYDLVRMMSVETVNFYTAKSQANFSYFCPTCGYMHKTKPECERICVELDENKQIVYHPIEASHFERADKVKVFVADNETLNN